MCKYKSKYFLVLREFQKPRKGEKCDIYTCALHITVGSTLASWLVNSCPDRVAWVLALAGDIVIALCSWARHLTLTVPLSTQVYK